ncbi:AlpA family phage regulatory protein [Vibrio parahaemolyticus]|uniref:AlpA family transcriptional regulator n=1 Tax=Vibrio parahaemolyticus TaxID=670 RepID=UPI000812D7E5|nr:AlpA family transcriptional regulator [Vibrio parahaemolyticus]EGQ8311725.1 AlpA family phage regulatory protein [Vibrio parahaemolyticus]EGQ8852004.1 AlpA family phage regulatory protein [Vibrio parahaemolyticus]EGQ8856629.1 AlpA family phage regulatory protein [Vibrio parahaemolyticus]EGQ8876117.1 AlpA family phage regulatory protein [Vibrio parahaemolyticus]EGQ8995397.1 AlpA family phage regulatory protein [Vibrio parahaemolyticus]
MKIIRLKEVMNLTGLSKTSIYEFSSKNQFPKSVALGGRAVGWVESEVHSWISDKMAQREVIENA